MSPIAVASWPTTPAGRRTWAGQPATEPSKAGRPTRQTRAEKGFNGVLRSTLLSTFITFLAGGLAIGCSRGQSPSSSAGTSTGSTPVQAGTTAGPTLTLDSAPATGPAAPGTTVKAVGLATSDSPYGEILVDDQGRTLYVFLNDTAGVATCTGDCAKAWPQFTVDRLLVPEGLNAADFRRDPATGQVIFKDRPLYYFSGDTKPGDSNGQGIGDVWFVVRTDGNPALEKA